MAGLGWAAAAGLVAGLLGLVRNFSDRGRRTCRSAPRRIKKCQDVAQLR